jgi:hypothetical protein
LCGQAPPAWDAASPTAPTHSASAPKQLLPGERSGCWGPAPSTLQKCLPGSPGRLNQWQLH